MASFGSLAAPFLPQIMAASRASGIPLPLLQAQIMQESTFNPNAVSKAGAIGLGQILPSTARDPGYGVAPVDPSVLTAPAENIRFTANYLAARGKAAGVEDWNDPAQAAKGLTAYNGGGDPNYADNVLRYVQPISATSSDISPDASASGTPSAPPLRPFFKPQTLPVRPGVDMDGISPGARGIFDALSKANIPGLEVVSGYRDPERNARVGGAKGSQHIHGNAIDINIEKLSPEQRQQVIDTAINAGARGIGIYPGGRSLHLDVRETPTAWGANASSPYSGVSDPNAYPEWARAGVAKLFGGGLPAQTSAYAAADRPVARPSSFALPQESASMANPADLPAPGAMEATGSAFAVPGGAGGWTAADNDQLMMALSLIANAIPNGQVAKDPGTVIKPWMDAAARREDRAYLRGKDARDYQLRVDESKRAQSNADRSYNLQVDANRRADEAAARAEAKPLIQPFKDAAGNTIYKQWDNSSRTWSDLPSAASAPAAAAPQPQTPPAMSGGVQGPPIPQDLMPPASAPASPAASFPPPPPGVNTEAWVKAQTENLAKNSFPSSNEDATALRKEIQSLPSYKNMAQAAPIYQGMADAAGRNTKAADLNLVYGLGKIMDPSSVVREGEMVMVKNTSSLPDWFSGLVAQLNGGAALTPETREKLMAEAYGRMQGYQAQYDQDIKQYRGIVERRRMNPDDVINNFGTFEPWKAPSSAGTTPRNAQPANDGATRKVINGMTYIRPKNSSSWFTEE